MRSSRRSTGRTAWTCESSATAPSTWSAPNREERIERSSAGVRIAPSSASSTA